ncbi:MAG: diguanylate cyclase [Pseudomonadota bacterium]
MTGHVLVADGALTTRILLKAILTEAHYDVSLVGDSASAIGILRHNYPGVLILGQMLADGPGTALLEWVRARPDTRALPVIMLSDQANPQSRIDALSAGADEMMAKPISEATLLARLRSLLRAYDSETALDERAGAVHDMGFSEASPEFIGPARIGIVGPDIAQARDWADLMTPHLQDKLIPMTPDEALGTAPAALYILSAATDPAAGLRQLADLRARAATRHAAIVLVHDPDDTATAVTALDLGANDLIAQPFDPREMALRLSIQLSRKYNDDRLRASVEDRLRLAVVDPLTGLFNRRYADAHTERVVSRAKDSGRSYAVILADIDRFKLVNDSYGHSAGDTVIREVAHRLRDNLRPNDMVARIGGEEFMVVMPDITTDSALSAARRLCARVRDGGIRIDGCPTPLGITASLGLALGMPGEPFEAVVARADGALYDAKNAGRDTVTVCAPHAA